MATALPGVTSSAVAVRVEPYRVLMRMQPTLSEPAARKMAKIFVEEGKRYNIHWHTLASIAFNESSLGLFRINPRSHDYGLMQINLHNIVKLGLDPRRVAVDDRLSVSIACKILIENRSRFSAGFQHWVGIYRSGTSIKVARVRASAISYDGMIKKSSRRIAGYEYQSQSKDRK